MFFLYFCPELDDYQFSGVYDMLEAYLVKYGGSYITYIFI